MSATTASCMSDTTASCMSDTTASCMSATTASYVSATTSLQFHIKVQVYDNEFKLQNLVYVALRRNF
jgi:hypothetical protein